MPSATSFTVLGFTVEGLPRANSELLAGHISPDEYFSTVREGAGSLELDPAVLAPQDAFELLQATTMIASSLERFGQGLGRPVGSTLTTVPGLEQAIITTARAASHPPHASATTYWIGNENQRFCFVDNKPGSPERVFGDLVRATDAVAKNVSNLLRDLLDDGLQASHAGDLRDAAAAIADLRESYRGLMVGPDPSHWELTPLGFGLMRNWLVQLRIAGTVRTPANAANLQSVSSLDALFGTVRSCIYRDLLDQRLPLLPFDDAVCLAADLERLDRRETVLDLLADRLGLEARGDEYDASKITFADDSGFALVEAVVALGTAWREWAGTHRRQIVEYLERYEQYLAQHTPGYTIPYMTVAATKSVGGKEHDVPEQIRRERHDHPLLAALRQAVKDCRVPNEVH